LSKRKFVYVPELNPSSFLFFFHKGDSDRSYSLRGFDSETPSLRYGTELRFTAPQILSLAQKPGNFCLDAPAHPVSDLSFWRCQINDLNRRYLKLPPRDLPAASSPLVSPDRARPASPDRFPILDADELRRLKTARRQDLERILSSPQSEDYVTWNFGLLLLRKEARLWWPALVDVARRANPQLSFRGAAEDLPSLSFWPRVPSPPEYERASRERMLASREPDWVSRASDPTPVEGRSEIDLVLSGRSYVIFVEAKLGSDVSMQTKYDPARNQIVRNIDCLLEEAGSRSPSFWLFVRDTGPARAYTQLVNQYKVRSSDLETLLPHRSPTDLDRIARNLTLCSWTDLYALVRDVTAAEDSLVQSVKWELEQRIFGGNR
jgi:hypothetical protein